jgi:glycosyltransferase involved in cell wall biosynthesis
MKILIIHTYYREKGGEDNVVATEAALLREAGHKVDLLCFQNPHQTIQAIFALFWALFNPFSYQKTLQKISAFEPDVVHLHNWHFAASPSVILACKARRVPMVYTLHNFRLLCPSGTLFHDGQLFLASIKQLFPWTAVRKGVYRGSVAQTFWLALTVYLHRLLGTWQKIDRYIVLTEFGKQVFEQANFGVPVERFVVKANSIPDLGVDPAQARGQHFLFIGRLVAEKGVVELLEAFAHSEEQVHLYGYGPLEPLVKSYSMQYPNIHYYGALPAERVAEKLRGCNALIFPSIWYEGMPITLLEAFATGTPVIASNIGSMMDMIRDGYNGAHFIAGSSQDLINKLEQWQTLSHAQKAQYSQNARQLYEAHYTQSKSLSALERIYTALINP